MMLNVAQEPLALERDAPKPEQKERRKIMVGLSNRRHAARYAGFSSS